MSRQLPLNAFAQTALSTGEGGILLLENNGFFLMEDSTYLLLEGPTTTPAGNGVVSIGPTSQGEVWNAGFRVAVHCATNVLEAVCRVYCGPGDSPAYFCDGTTWGSTGDGTTETPDLHVGQYVYAVWTGGDPGTAAYLSISGTRTI